MTEMHKNERKAREKPKIFPQEFNSGKILRARLCSRVRAATRITPREPERKGQSRRERNHNNREPLKEKGKEKMDLTKEEQKRRQCRREEEEEQQQLTKNS
jgi:hypothetical protein